MKRYLKIWLLMTGNSVQALLANRLGIIVFTFGKLIRVFLYFGFIYFLFHGAKQISGYGQTQALLFMATFIFMGTAGQMLFREVYRFRGKIVSGEFDFDLVRPIHPLLRNVLGGFDLLDLITIPVFLVALIKILVLNTPSLANTFLFLALMANGMIIMLSIHILVAALIVINNEVDHAVMVYRDIETMGRFPVDIYREPLRQILTFVVPIGIMFTVPAKALLGIVSPVGIIGALCVGATSIYLSLRFWNFAVKKYSSASS